MEKGKTLGEQAGEIREMLRSERMSEIDFDALILWLDAVSPILNEARDKAESFAYLRLDYEGRIVGMVKAMAAVDRTGRNYDDAVASFEALPKMSGEELVACYRRMSARFRDMFPTSFTSHGPAATRSRSTNLSVYK